MRNCWCQGPLSNIETEYNHYVKSQCSAESRMFVLSAYKWSATRLLKDCAYKILPILNKIAMLFLAGVIKTTYSQIQDGCGSVAKW